MWQGVQDCKSRAHAPSTFYSFVYPLPTHYSFPRKRLPTSQAAYMKIIGTPGVGIPQPSHRASQTLSLFLFRKAMNARLLRTG